MNLDEFKKSLENPPKMTDENKSLAFHTIMLHNGVEKQHIIVMEELAELAQQVSKRLRGNENRISLLEEMADVSICLSMLQYMNDITSCQLEDAINIKLKRGIESCFSQKNKSDNIIDAIITLRNELNKHEDLYSGFIGSITSALKDDWCCGLPFEPEEIVAKKILDRIIGDET